jgi:hypothetical protein
MLVYTDHTYGMDNWFWEHLVMQQSKGVLSHPVFDYYKESWEDKKEYAYSAARVSDQLLGNSVAGIAAKIPVDERTIVVFNPLSWARTDAVRVLHRALKIGRSDEYYDIVDNTTGERVPYQAITGDHRTQARVRGLPGQCCGQRARERVLPRRDGPGLGWRIEYPGQEPEA